jgi:hypothetical protein
MNHSTTQPTGAKEFFGKMLFVHAGCALRAGDEVTTTYSEDAAALRQWGIQG